MPSYAVTSEALATAGSHLGSAGAAIGQDNSFVGPIAGAAAGTPAAGALDEFVSQLSTVMSQSNETINALGAALSQAATAYALSDQSAAGSYGRGHG